MVVFVGWCCVCLLLVTFHAAKDHKGLRARASGPFPGAGRTLYLGIGSALQVAIADIVGNHSVLIELLDADADVDGILESTKDRLG